MRFLADMNISPKTVEALRRKGWDIQRVSDLLPKDATDQRILEFARQEKSVLITQDLDFSALLALSGYSQPSLITLRLSVVNPGTVTQKLLNVLPEIEDQLEAGCIVIIHDKSIRRRRLPIHFE